MGRGGARQGKPGQAYSNRTDLGVAKLPAVAAPGQTYGVAGQQMAAQQAVPMAPQPTPTGSAGAAGGETGPPPVAPGSLTPLTAPTQRPDEPMTAGAPFGPGPASTGLPNPVQQQWASGKDMLTELAAQQPNSSIASLLHYLNGGA